jgi:hypothetical protein
MSGSSSATRDRCAPEPDNRRSARATPTARLNDLQLTERPIRITKKLVDDTLAQFEGILERAPLETRVATVRDLFERVDFDSRHRSDAVSVWLRR